MVFCYVYGCYNRSDSKLFSFHSFPHNEVLKGEWLELIGKAGQIITNQRICSDHFLDNDFIIIGNRRYLQPNAVPSVNLPYLPSLPIPERSKQRILTLLNEQSKLASSDISILNEENIVVTEDKLPILPSTSTSIVQAQKRRISFANILEKSPSKTPSSTSSSIKRKLVGKFHTYSKSPTHYHKELSNLRQRINKLKRKIDISQKTSKRRKIRITSLKEITKDLKKNDALSTNAMQVLESTFSDVPLAIMKRMVANNRDNTKSVIRAEYPAELKAFAMTLQFYSSKAYQYVRKTFQLSLPAPSTIRAWLTKLDCTPGFTQSAFDALKVKADKFIENGHQLLGALMLDEMSVRKEISVEHHSQTVWGYIDVGANIAVANERDEASEVLVLMVVGVNENFKIPIGYFFVNKLSGEEKANLVKQALLQVDKTGIDILSVTCDGPSVHFKMMEVLGCKVHDPDSLKTYFDHPADAKKVEKRKIHVIFDICHMLKLVRNNWAATGILIDEDGNLIKWDFIEKLHALQDKSGLYLGNKLRKQHIQWKQHVMKVNLAAQTLSNSVADALEFLCSDLQLEEFKDVMPTVKFIRKINNLFDILNSRNPYGKGMNTPMKELNEKYWRPQVENTLTYIANLKLASGQLMYRSKKQVPVLGFIVSTKSLLAIFDNECKKTQRLCYLLTYKFSQDHLELFFCGVRMRRATNNNPSALEFFHTYRRMLMHIDLKNFTGNCLPQDSTSILAVKSTREISNIHQLRNQDLEEDAEDILEQQINLMLPTNLDEFSENVVAYISGFVVKSLKKVIKCPRCVEALTSWDDEDETLMFIRRKSRGGLIFPSKSVVKICEKIEKRIQTTVKIVGGLPSKNRLYKVLMSEKERFLMDANLFTDLSDHVFDYAPYEENHRKVLIENTIKMYSIIRQHSTARKINEDISGQKVRKVLNKIILFRHQ